MSRSKRILLTIVAVLVLIQFIRPTRNISNASQPNDIFIKYRAPDSVEALVKAACYDCHSNNTRYPLYTNIQPVGIWMQHHVDEGKHELNFSEFAAYPAKKAIHKMEETIEMVKEKHMPISSYTWIHKDAVLSDSQRNAINLWADSVIKKQSLNKAPVL